MANRIIPSLTTFLILTTSTNLFSQTTEHIDQNIQHGYNLIDFVRQNEGLATLICLIIGGIAGFIGSIILVNINKKAELEKIYIQATNTALSELVAIIAQVNQTMTWYCWQAKNKPETFSIDTVKEYDLKIEGLLLQMASKSMLISGYSREVSLEINKVCNKIFEYDGEISEYGKSIGTEKNLLALESLGRLYTNLLNLNSEISILIENKLRIKLWR